MSTEKHKARDVATCGIEADELIVDNFAGGGWASTGIELAVGRPVDIAINHDSKHRLGIVTVHGVDYQIVDIGMRMLSPRELFRAQGFPDE
jgi:hypothetical protein